MRNSRRWRKLRAGWRDTWLLIRQFAAPLAAFSAAILGGGALYYLLARLAGEPLDNLAQAFYHTLTLTFLEPTTDFPQAWYLEVFFFIMPVIGIIILAQGVADFGVLFFNRRARGKEWEMAVASTFNAHIVLVGLGHLGYRVVRNLCELDQDVVVIELNPKADLVAATQKLGVPVIREDANRLGSLEEAGIARARAIILCTQNDSLNLQIALKARKLNPSLQVVVRIFDDDFAQALQEQFGFQALSATGMAAPAFAAAAAGVEMTRPLTIEGKALSLARVTVAPGSPLAGITIGDLEQRYETSVVLLRRGEASDLHPPAARQLTPGDTVAVLGGPAEISALAQANNHPAG